MSKKAKEQIQETPEEDNWSKLYEKATEKLGKELSKELEKAYYRFLFGE